MGRKAREEVIQSQMLELEKDLFELQRNRRWTCAICCKKSRLRALDLVRRQEHKAAGCWATSYYVICPKCRAQCSVPSSSAAEATLYRSYTRE